MAVKTSDEPNLAHDFDDDDDDGPVIYKRYSSSKKNQLHSDVRKSSSHSHDGQISNAPSAYMLCDFNIWHSRLCHINNHTY